VTRSPWIASYASTFNGPVVAADWHGTIGDDPNPSDPGPS